MRFILSWLTFILTLACLAPGVGAREATPAPDLVLTGVLTRADHEHYREVPFDLPEGVTRLSVILTYTGRENRSVIDLGLMDPDRFRGWSGGARDRITLSTEEATSGYLPGPLTPGRWRLLLGAPNIRPEGEARYEARVYFERAARPAEFAPSFPEPAPLNPAPGWYRGDLHMHTAHSDASCRTQSGGRAPCPTYRTVEAAAARGLDFIAVTDHNTTSGYGDLRQLQPAFDTLLLVAGREVTTFFGHANVFGPTAFLDFRMTEGSAEQTGRWLEAARAQGGLVSINHPGMPSGEICMGCGWTAELPGLDAVQAVEVINGGTLAQTGSAEGPLQGFDFWHTRLNAGARLIGIGGSDNHDALRPLEERGAIGNPTTVVHMPALSTAGLLEGLRQGRVFIDIDGDSDRFLDMSAQAGDVTVPMGGAFKARPGQAVRVNVQARGAAGGQLEMIVDGAVVPDLARPIATNDAEVRLDWTVGRSGWLRVNVRDAAGRLILVGNPIFAEAIP